MLVKQLYTTCLAQGAYFIESEGEAVVIDPLREYQPYLDLASQTNSTIKYIFETHFHADFVSGHVDLAEKTGADIVFGPNASTNFKSIIALDNQEFKVGKLTLRVLHTPGHTLESSCFLLLDENQQPHCIFTGDTLFIGDVGRPDLAIKSDLTEKDLAGMLYDSLRQKIMVLPDDVIVYPAHGAGSACGKNMSKETFDTLGNQKKTNYALANLSKDEFIKEVTSGILPPPQYFAKNAQLNKIGYKNFDDVTASGTRALTINEFTDLISNTDVLVLDVRKPEDFVASHIPNSLFIGIDGQFAPWVGALITDLHQKIILITPPRREEEAVMRLSRVGYDNCIGYLEGGITAWINSGKKAQSITSISAQEFEQEFLKQTINVLDVRKPGEYEANHIENIKSFPLDYITEWVGNLSKQQKYFIHCAGGYRSVIASSILKQNGFNDVVNIEGGFAAIKNTQLTCTEFVCSSKK